MKNVFNLLLVFTLLSTTLVSCEKEDESEELDIEFKMDSGYTFSDQTLEGGTDVKIGIEASTKKAKDPLIQFNISESVDGAADVSVFTEAISTASYDYDYEFTLGTESGSTHKYTFTITNKDGIIKQKSLTITVQ